LIVFGLIRLAISLCLLPRYFAKKRIWQASWICGRCGTKFLPQ
jgi:hypothetical protein